MSLICRWIFFFDFFLPIIPQIKFCFIPLLTNSSCVNKAFTTIQCSTYAGLAVAYCLAIGRAQSFNLSVIFFPFNTLFWFSVVGLPLLLTFVLRTGPLTEGGL